MRRTGLATVVAVLVAGVFWAGNSFAWAFGLGRAYDDALGLGNGPEVIIEVTEPLPDLPPGVEERPVARSGDGPARYRYRGFRLLVESGDRLFLVPARWTRASRTVVVPYDGAVRIQLVPAPVR